MGAVPPSEAVVLFDIVDEERGFVDHGELGDARRKIHPVSHLDKLAESVGGMDHEGIPFLSLQDQDGADIGVGQFQGALQGDRKQVVAVEGDVAEIGEFLQCGELRGPSFQVVEACPKLILDGMKGLDDSLQFVGDRRAVEPGEILGQGVGNLFSRCCG